MVIDTSEGLPSSPVALADKVVERVTVFVFVVLAVAVTVCDVVSDNVFVVVVLAVAVTV